MSRDVPLPQQHIVGRRNITTGNFATVRWNNIFSTVLGLVAAIYVIVVLTSTVLGDTASFIGLVVIGGFG